MNLTNPEPDLVALRKDLARFIRELSYENYLYGSGQKEVPEIVPIYERFGHLFAKDLAKNCLDRKRSAHDEEEKRSYKHLYQFAFFGYVGNLCKRKYEELAKKMNELSINVRSEKIGYRSIVPRLTNEPDAEIRREIDDGMASLELELNEIRKEIWDITNEVFRDFGYSDYIEGCSDTLGIDYEWLKEELILLLDNTEKKYYEEFIKFSEDRLGYTIDKASKCDFAYLMRGDEWDDKFPVDGMVEKCTKFLEHMKI
ncbi:MAG: hypothetical protein ABIC40_06120, partial [bacterium]